MTDRHKRYNQSPKGRQRYRIGRLKESESRRYVDPVILYRARNGEVVGPIRNFTEKYAVIKYLTEIGRSANEIARILKTTQRTVIRWRRKINNNIPPVKPLEDLKVNIPS